MTRTVVLAAFTTALVSATLIADLASAQAPPESVTAVRAITGVVALTTGHDHGCAVTDDRHVLCWGSNEQGQLGSGATTNQVRGALPVDNVPGTGPLTGAIDVAAGDDHTCAVLVNHEARCWGGGGAGQLGSGTTDPSSRPAPVLDVAGSGRLHGVATITADGSVTCARLLNGQVRCWGDDAFGQLGNGSASPTGSARPVVVKAVSGSGPLTQVTQLDAGARSVCARLASGRVVCWGDNTYGQLGDGTTDRHLRPVDVENARGTAPLTGVRRVSAGGQSTCAVLTDATARCWGDNGYGQLGDGTMDDHRRPTPVANASDSGPLHGIDHLDVGYAHACARLTNGEVRCWGDNEYDEVGYGVENGPNVLLPVAVRNRTDTGNLTGTTRLQSTAFHTCVRLQNGQARCWGFGNRGGLGDRDVVDRSLPVPVLAEPVLMAPGTAEVAP